jgi:three-Cys-motif partner protein
MASNEKVQRFGGPWSLIKTDVVEQYLRFFNTALKNQKFERVYIDAFAGSGAFRYIEDTQHYTLFGPRDPKQDIHDGSARRALKCEPPFDRIIFIEQDETNIASLRDEIEKSGHLNATVVKGDSNELLKKFCEPRRWSNRRGVIFLDPFGMNVDWGTLVAVAGTKAVDVWLLFPLAGLVRNLPNNAAALDQGKRAAVTRVLGTENWYDEFYTSHSRSLITNEIVAYRAARVNQIEAYVKKRLETIFPYVEQPKRLRGTTNAPLFSLFFAVSNPSPRAIRPAQRAASYILKHA